MNNAVQRVKVKGTVPIYFTRRGQGRRVFTEELHIPPELTTCQTRRDARRLIEKKARELLDNTPGPRCSLKRTPLKEIIATQ